LISFSNVFPPRRVLAACLLGTATLGFAVAPASRDVLETTARQSVLAMRGPLSGVAARDGHALAVGPRGTVLLSRDAGKTWQQVPVPVAADLTTVRFTADGTAWAVGHDAVVLRSGDGGESWVRVLDGRSLYALMTGHYGALAEGGDEEAGQVLKEVEQAAAQSATPGVLAYPFLDISIDEHGEGFLAGAFGFLLHTTDGGKTWEPWIERAGNDRRMHLYAIERTPGGTVFVAGEQGLVRRYDPEGGRFVAVETPYDGTWFGLLATGSKLIAYGLRGNAWVSADEGQNWTQLALGSDATVVAALAPTPERLVFVTQKGEVLVSEVRDDGVTDVPVPRGGEVLAATVLGAGQLALTRVNGVLVVPLPSN
jgi:photosystem II stability/assembly factor-like uncharacterized protein